MPRGDRTGPLGQGPMTGRAAGFCAGYPALGFENPGPGRGQAFSWGGGRGFGGGGGGGRRGWRHRFYATGLTGWQAAMTAPPGPMPEPYAAPYAPIPPAMTREQELGALQSQSEYFEGALEEIKKRIGDLEAKAEE